MHLVFFLSPDLVCIIFDCVLNIPIIIHVVPEGTQPALEVLILSFLSHIYLFTIL